MTPRVVWGFLVGVFVGEAMRLARNLPAARNWGRTMPPPAVLPRTVMHPREGLRDSWWVCYCETDAEIVETITQLWRPAPPDMAHEEPT